MRCGFPSAPRRSSTSRAFSPRRSTRSSTNACCAETVEHDDVRLRYFVDVEGVAQHLLVIDDGEEGRRAIGREPLGAWSEHEAGPAGAEAGDLLFPFRLQRRRADDEDPLDALAPRQQLAAGDGLDGLAERHVVGEQSALAEGEMHRSVALIRQQRMGQDVERRAAGGNIGGEGGGPSLSDGFARLLARRMAFVRLGILASLSLGRAKARRPAHASDHAESTVLKSRPTVAMSRALGNTSCTRMHKI
jgi:hypothetical protein